MNATRAPYRAARKLGISLTLITLFLCRAQAQKHIYVLSITGGGKLTTYSADGKQVSQISPGCMYCTGLALGADGKIYVSSYQQPDDIAVFSPDGSRLNSLTVGDGMGGIAIQGDRILALMMGKDGFIVLPVSVSGTPLAAPMRTHLDLANAVSVSPGGWVYVVSKTNDVVMAFRPEGNIGGLYSGLQNPGSVAIAKDGKTYVAMRWGVATFEKGKRTQLTLRGKNSSEGLSDASAVAVDDEGTVYVVYNDNMDHDNLIIYTPEGKPVGAFRVPPGVVGIVVR